MAEHGSVRVQGIDPRTGRLVAESIQATTPEQLETLVQAAARALPAWSATPATHRAAALRRVAAVLDDGGDEVIRLAGLETGLGPARRGAGESPAAARIRRIVPSPDPVPQAQQLTLNPAIAPAGILPRQLLHQAAHLVRDRRSSRHIRVGPFLSS